MTLDFPLSAPLTPRERPARPAPSPVPPADLERLVAAVAAIPNEGESELAYEKWFACVAAIHHATGGSPDGLALALDFSARSSKHNPDFLAERVWPYLRDDRERAHTADFIYTQAARHGWQDPAIADAFEVVADAVTAGPKKRRFQPQHISQFAQGAAPAWLIKGVIPKAELVVIYGESGSGKSFFVFDMAVHVALGRQWRGNKVKAGRVVIITAEGQAGARKRAQAAAEHYGVRLEDLDILIIANAPRFTDADDIRELVDELRVAGPVAMVVVDTLSRVLAGADENSNEDMGRVVAHCATITAVTAAVVTLVHHSGKDASKGARGWSGLRAAADTEIEIVRAGDVRTATLTKQKDGEDGLVFGFRLGLVTLGEDEDGDKITTCVVEPVEGAALKAAQVVAKMGEIEKAVVEAVDTLNDLDPEDPPGVAQVAALVAEKLEKRVDNVKRAIEKLAEKSILDVSGGKVRRA